MLHFGSRQLLWDFPFLVNATFLKRKPIGLSQIGRQGSRKELSKSYPFSEWYNALRSLNAERKAVLGGGTKTQTHKFKELTRLCGTMSTKGKCPKDNCLQGVSVRSKLSKGKLNKG